jgi:hypothetical protein
MNQCIRVIYIGQGGLQSSVNRQPTLVLSYLGWLSRREFPKYKLSGTPFVNISYRETYPSDIYQHPNQFNVGFNP